MLQLAQAGKLRLADALGKYLTNYPNKELAAKVTIGELLTNTGGTGDIWGPDYDKHRLELRTLQDYINLYGNRPLRFEPGSRWEYSNYGFILLGAVIEKVSGQSYYDYVREHIYVPAGMTSTGSEPEDPSDAEPQHRLHQNGRRDGNRRLASEYGNVVLSRNIGRWGLLDRRRPARLCECSAG